MKYNIRSFLRFIAIAILIPALYLNYIGGLSLNYYAFIIFIFSGLLFLETAVLGIVKILPINRRLEVGIVANMAAVIGFLLSIISGKILLVHTLNTISLIKIGIKGEYLDIDDLSINVAFSSILCFGISILYLFVYWIKYRHNKAAIM